MKVAFLFSGQYRRIQNDYFKYSLSTLTKDLDYSIFSFCWEEEGKSLNHSDKLSKIKKIDDVNSLIKKLFNDFNLENYASQSFLDFQENLPNNYLNILNNKKYHKNTIHSLPQIYTLQKCYELIGDKLNNYDLIFRCRYDSIFLHPLNLYPLEKIMNDQILYNINFGRSFYPNRVYDIFFGGSAKSMDFLSDIWIKTPHIISNKFSNGLCKRDACRIIFYSSYLHGNKTKSFDTRICDIFRDAMQEKNENYIISSHFSKIKLNKKIIISWIYFFKWCKKRNLKFTNILRIFIFTIILFPFSYLKRIKYLKL